MRYVARGLLGDKPVREERGSLADVAYIARKMSDQGLTDVLVFDETGREVGIANAPLPSGWFYGPAGLEKAPMIPTPIKPEITIDDLNKLDIRVGTILSVEDVPGADKLVQLRVSFGDHERTIVSGMKQERANPKEIEGRQALFVVNLAPRKMKGVMSHGMVFDLGYADGVLPVLAVPEAPVPDGTRAG